MDLTKRKRKQNRHGEKASPICSKGVGVGTAKFRLQNDISNLSVERRPGREGNIMNEVITVVYVRVKKI